MNEPEQWMLIIMLLTLAYLLGALGVFLLGKYFQRKEARREYEQAEQRKKEALEDEG